MKVPPRNPDGTFNVLVEIPKGSRNKYEYDEEMGVMVLDRPLFSPFGFPVDYGHLPGTLAEDGDPVDALLVVRFPTFPGCVVQARPLGILRMRDEKGPDDKVLFVPASDPYFSSWKEISDVPRALLDEISHFFTRYKELEPGKHTEVKGWEGVEKAEKFIQEAIARAGSKE